MERRSKVLLKHILDTNMEFQKVMEVFRKKDFLPITKVSIDIEYDDAKLIIDAFEINEDLKKEKIFNICMDLYTNKISTQDAINQIEKII